MGIYDQGGPGLSGQGERQGPSTLDQPTESPDGRWWSQWSGDILGSWNFFPPKGYPHSSIGNPGSDPGSGRSAEEGIGYPLQYSWASLVAQLVKESVCSVGDLGLIPGL